MRGRIPLLCVAVGWLVSWSAEAAVSPSRIAVMVGNNDGGPGKPRLKHAERDAKRMRDVMDRLGGVHHRVLLQGRGAETLRRTLARLARETSAIKEPPTLFFFYSGHADGNALLMGKTRFSFKELRKSLSDFPARLVIAFLDACQSGAVTRPKGGRTVSVVDARFNDSHKRGRVFITSAAADESAQESDTIAASFFTHFLLSALRGAADHSGDGRVTLQEAYGYAYAHTLARTAGTMAGPQHANYEYNLQGSGQVVLTELSSELAYIRLPAGSQGTYLIQRAADDHPLAEVVKRPGKPLRVALPPGRYELCKTGGLQRLMGQVTVKPNRTTQVRDHQLRPKAMVVATRKGGTRSTAPRFRLSTAYSFSSGILGDDGWAHGIEAEATVRLGPLYLGGRFDHLRSWLTRESFDVYNVPTPVEYSLARTAGHLVIGWWFPLTTRWSIYTAAAVGGGTYWRTRDQTASVISRPYLQYRIDAGLELTIVPHLAVALWGGGGQVFTEECHPKQSFHGGLRAGIVARL